MSRRFLAAVAIITTAALAACVVVPIDPQTGQPYPLAAAQAHNSGPSQVTVVQPPPAAPQQLVLTARLYPLNTQASNAGMLTAVVVDQRSGRGSFTVSYLGDTLHGEATRVDDSYAAFGHVHRDVLGPARHQYSGQRGIANGFGNKGVSTQCEYLITGPGIGTGACLFSDGARYQLHFGG